MVQVGAAAVKQLAFVDGFAQNFGKVCAVIAAWEKQAIEMQWRNHTIVVLIGTKLAAARAVGIFQREIAGIGIDEVARELRCFSVAARIRVAAPAYPCRSSKAFAKNGIVPEGFLMLCFVQYFAQNFKVGVRCWPLGAR